MFSRVFSGPDVSPTLLPPTMTAEQLVGMLNSRADRVAGWQSEDVRVRMKGKLPISLGATLAVSEPRNLRLIAHSPLGPEADVGSNAQTFWVWSKREPSNSMLTARHQDLSWIAPILEQRFAIPIRPDWLMETLAVGRLTAEQMRLVDELPTSPGAAPSAEPYKLELMSRTPGGQTIIRQLQIDRRTGDVLQQSMRDGTGRVIAAARFGDHRPVGPPQAGVRLPHQIELDWPGSGDGLVLSLDNIAVTPPGGGPMGGPTLFEEPDYAGYKRVDLGQMFAQFAPNQSPTGAVTVTAPELAGSTVSLDGAATQPPAMPLSATPPGSAGSPGVVRTASTGQVRLDELAPPVNRTPRVPATPAATPPAPAAEPFQSGFVPVTPAAGSVAPAVTIEPIPGTGQPVTPWNADPAPADDADKAPPFPGFG